MKYLLLCFMLMGFLYSKSQEFEFTMDVRHPQKNDYLTVWPVWGCTESIRPDMAIIMDSLVRIIQPYPALIFQIEMHTDCRFDSLTNCHFSQQRADTMRNFILARGVDSSRILAVGKGEDELYIEKCRCDLSDYRGTCTETEHQRNRRIVLRVIAVKDTDLFPIKKE